MSNRPTNRAWHLVSRPDGMIRPENFELRESSVAPLEEGQALVRLIYLSLDPTDRVWASDREQYMTPVGLGEPMRSVALGVVEESRKPDLKAGAHVYGLLGWQDYSVVDRDTPMMVVEPRPGLPLTAHLAFLGFIGITAYIGVIDMLKPVAGQTMVVTTAAGAVGSIAAQIGKIMGCRVVGVTGSEEKCRWLRDELKLDAAINYKTENVEAAIRRHCPAGVDMVFENVGGAQLDASLANINNFARIAICGLISQYNTDAPTPGPYRFAQVLMHRLTIRGFIVNDHPDRFAPALAALEAWHQEGRLKYRVHIEKGLGDVPRAVNRLFSGEHQGKLLVQIAPEPG